MNYIAQLMSDNNIEINEKFDIKGSIKIKDVYLNADYILLSDDCIIQRFPHTLHQLLKGELIIEKKNYKNKPSTIRAAESEGESETHL